jgi:hypothetical protein
MTGEACQIRHHAMCISISSGQFWHKCACMHLKEYNLCSHYVPEPLVYFNEWYRLIQSDGSERGCEWEVKL